jgi:hypothetical protein
MGLSRFESTTFEFVSNCLFTSKISGGDSFYQYNMQSSNKNKNISLKSTQFKNKLKFEDVSK